MVVKVVNVLILLALIVNLVVTLSNESNEDSNENDLKQAVEALASSSSSFTSINHDQDGDDIDNEIETNVKAKQLASPVASQKKCEEITVPMCRNMEYNVTSMPNQFNHETQQEAAMEAHQFWALVEINCAKELRFFLCSMYTPICLPNYAQPIKACKSVCVRARIGCEKYMKKFGFDWPEHMNCDLFPEYGSTNQVCMDPMDAQFQTAHKNKKLNINHNLGVVTTTTTSVGELMSDVSQDKSEEITDITPSLSDIMCIKPFVKKQSQSFGGLDNCALDKSCSGSGISGVKFFDAHKTSFTFYWLIVWSVLCLFSSLSTTLTFMLYPSRFKYPEKPIIFMAISYLFVAVGYLIRLTRVANLATNQDECDASKSFDCTLSFILIYYFGMVSAIWWVIVAFTWFLAAGRKWSSEAIAKYHVYFHLIAWLLPFFQTCTILAYSHMDVDSLSGICLVGNMSVRNLFVFLIMPSLVYMCIGVMFLILGFVSLFRIRKTIQQKQAGIEARKLEKLMMRIGVFSILYTVPATCVLACQFYEKMYRSEWERSFLCTNAAKSQLAFSYEYRKFCAHTNSTNVFGAEPEFVVFLLKYLMSLIIGVTSGFWIWTNKTWLLWKSFFSSTPNHLSKTFCSVKSAVSSSSSRSSSNATHTTALSDLNSFASNQRRGCCFRFCFSDSNSNGQTFENDKKSRDSIIYFQANDDIESNPHNFKNIVNTQANNENPHILIDDNVIYQKHHSSTSTPMHHQNQYKNYLQHNAKLYACNTNHLVETAVNYNSSTQSVTSQPIYQTHGNFNSNRQAVIYYDYTGQVPTNDMNTMSSKYSVPASIASSKK